MCAGHSSPPFLAYTRGLEAEDKAALLLERKGYKILERRFRCLWGEIDLIAQSGDVLAFVEVKRRQGLWEGAECIDAKKKNRIMRTALAFLVHSSLPLESDMRFDAILLAGPHPIHIENAWYYHGDEAGDF